MHASKKAVHHTVFLPLFQVFFMICAVPDCTAIWPHGQRPDLQTGFSTISHHHWLAHMTRFCTVSYGFVNLFLVY